MTDTLPSESSVFFTARISSHLSALPGMSRLTGAVQPLLESYGIPERVANLETYARTRVTALNSIPAVVSLSTQASQLATKVHETKNAVTERVATVKSSAVSAVSTGVSTVSSAAQSAKSTVSTQTSAALASIQSHKTHALELAHTSTASLVNKIITSSLGTTATTAALFAESKICGVASLVSDVSEVALDRVLAPEADEETPLTAEDESTSTEHLGQPTKEVVQRILALAGKASKRLISKSQRNVQQVKDVSQHAVESLRQRVVSVLPSASSAADTPLAVESSPSSLTHPSVTFAGFSITPVSNFAEKTLSGLQHVDARRQQLVQLVRCKVQYVHQRASGALPSVHTTIQSLQRHTLSFIDHHPLAEHMIKTLNTRVLPTVLPARLHATVQHYLAWLSASDPVESEAVLADDEREVEDDSVDLRSLSGDADDATHTPATHSPILTQATTATEAAREELHQEETREASEDPSGTSSYADVAKVDKKKKKHKHGHQTVLAHSEDID